MTLETDERNNKVRVILVDDHAIVRDGVKMVLDNDPSIEVIGEAATVDETCRLVERLQPDVVLLDVNLGMENSLDRMAEIISISDHTHILILTGVLDDASNRRAADNGAHGIVLKHDSAEHLLAAVHRVADGNFWFDHSLTASLLSEAKKTRITREINVETPLASLTQREFEIALKIGEGLVNKDIANALGISEKTVRNTLTTIFEKLGVTGRVELALFIARNNIQGPDDTGQMS